ncbi:MAG: mechanosensitive ion channel family protein [Brevundimonas sp.]|uniref:mechanosensitive ion channel family protein n=1 Tax=Brevundimonas sp. TaxID=1871086 RepID=UPI003919A80D
MHAFDALRAQIADYPMLETALGVLILLTTAFLADWVTRHILLRIGRRVLKTVRLHNEATAPIAQRLARIAPALVIHNGIQLVPHLPPGAMTVVQNVASAFVILTIVLTVSSVLDLVNARYARRPSAANRPIKGYIQMIKIALFAIAAILIIATLIERSPLLLLSGLGAMAAVLMLVFQGTILSLVASIQLTSNDMLRVGDWIEAPHLNADGDVIDIALHTVKVQNWDRTITAIPTSKLITDSYKNWRGMSESGGRRIKRSLMIDQNSIRFLEPGERENLCRFALIDDYIRRKQDEIDAWNKKLAEAGREPVNTRRMTNIGAFRAYVQSYLLDHPRIHSTGLTLLVRQLDPTAHGLPLEIYCFTTTTAWVEYESIQADIFDHMIAILPEFGLRLYQQPSGLDVAELSSRLLPSEKAATKAQASASSLK